MITILIAIFVETPQNAPKPKPVVSTRVIQQLIQDLSSTKSQKRVRATVRLIKIGAPALPHLRNAATSGDPERCYRARRIYDLIRPVEFSSAVRKQIRETEEKLKLANKRLRYFQKTLVSNHPSLRKAQAESEQLQAKLNRLSNP